LDWGERDCGIYDERADQKLHPVLGWFWGDYELFFLDNLGNPHAKVNPPGLERQTGHTR
jgi:hypothetical protein